MNKEPGIIRTLSFAFLLGALAMLVIGGQLRHVVLADDTIKPPPPPVSEPNFGAPQSAPPFVPPPPSQPAAALGPISELALIENATFTGVTRKDGKLFFTYDPTKKRGKQSCPT
jgi:hypothetical protein